MCFGGGSISSSALVGILYTLCICLLLLLFYIYYILLITQRLFGSSVSNPLRNVMCILCSTSYKCVYNNIIQHNNDTTNYILSCVCIPVQVLQESNACLRTGSHLLCPRQRKRPAHTKNRICIFKHIIIGCQPRRRVRYSQTA